MLTSDQRRAALHLDLTFRVSQLRQAAIHAGIPYGSLMRKDDLCTRLARAGWTVARVQHALSSDEGGNHDQRRHRTRGRRTD